MTLIEELRHILKVKQIVPEGLPIRLEVMDEKQGLTILLDLAVRMNALGEPELLNKDEPKRWTNNWTLDYAFIVRYVNNEPRIVLLVERWSGQDVTLMYSVGSPQHGAHKQRRLALRLLYEVGIRNVHFLVNHNSRSYKQTERNGTPMSAQPDGRYAGVIRMREEDWA